MPAPSPLPPAALFRQEIAVPAEAIDENRHVNNVVWVQWMQDVAIAHSAATGGTAAMRADGGGWVARSHKIEYRQPAFAGDALTAHTWVAQTRRVSSLRRYRFFRAGEDRPLVEAETEWVYVDAASGRPRPIPDSVRACYTVLEGPPGPPRA